MAVLLIADVNDGHLATDAVAKTLTAVKGLGDVHVLVAGTGGDAAAADAAKLSGVAKVLFADDHAYCHGMAESTAALIAGLAGGYSHIVGASTAFNKNVLQVVNTRLDADFDPDRFEHVARFDEQHEWIEMCLRTPAATRVRVGALDLDVEFAAGEEMRTEISAKFTRARVETVTGDAGLRLEHWWTDPAGDFALSLARRA